MSRRGAVLEGWQPPKPMEFEYAQRQAEMAQDERLFNADQRRRGAAQQRTASQEAIDKVKDLDHIGNSTVDIATDNALSSIRQNATKMADAQVPINEINAYIQREVPIVANGHTIAKNYSDQMKLQSIELAKLYGGDPQKLYQQSMQKAVPDWIEADETGNLKYRPMIDPNKNYLAEMESLDNLPSWVPESDALIEFVSKLPKDETTSNVVVRDKGFAHIDKQSEETNTFFEPTYDAKNQLTGKKIKLDENGVLPDRQFKIFMSDPKSKAQFAREYLPIKKAQQEEYDRMGLGPMSKEADLLLQKQVATKIVDGDISGLKSKSKVQDITPKPTVIKNYNGGSGGNKPEVTIRDMYDRIHKRVYNPEEGEPMILANGKSVGVPMNELESDEINAILDEVNKNRAADEKYNSEEVFIAGNYS